MTTPNQPRAPGLPERALPEPTESQPRARVLIVDDQPIIIQALYQAFSAEHDVFMATSGEQALAFCRATPPDLVLLDVVMPGMDGLAVCRELKRDPKMTSIPVIFVTALNDSDEEAACWDAGGVDFITKPVNARTVRNRVRAHLTLKHQADLLRQLAWIDGLTGIANRRQFDERLSREWQRCRRNGHVLSVATIDFDFFKAYNDTYGHLAGDDCLRLVASALQACVARPGDLAARIGGEEFSCILPESDLAGCLVVAERIERSIRELNIPHEGAATEFVTVSVGIASTVPGKGMDPNDLLRRADEGLYEAKRTGRSRVCHGPAEDAPSVAERAEESGH